MLHFPDIILGTENPVTNKTSLHSGVYMLEGLHCEMRREESSNKWSSRAWSTLGSMVQSSCLWLKWETKDEIIFFLFLPGTEWKEGKGCAGITILRREEMSLDEQQTALKSTSRL